MEKKLNTPLIVAGRTFQSRLMLGTGKYKDLTETKAAIVASGAELVTFAVRRTPIGSQVVQGQEHLLDYLPPNEFTLLPNTAGCYTAEDCIRTLRLARELLDGHNLVKLEVLGDKKTLYPNVVDTLKALDVLVADGFDVMVYTNDDPIVAKLLEKNGAAAIMPLGAPIGSGLGLQNPNNIKFILEEAKVPVIVDAGVGTASDVAVAMELGCDGVLLNSAVAHAKDPIKMAKAMRLGVEAGRFAYLAGRMPAKAYASASSPLTDLIE